MAWIIASIPFWVLGVALLVMGIMAIVKVATNEKAIPVFKSVDDGSAVVTGFAFVLFAGIMLATAAKVAS